MKNLFIAASLIVALATLAGCETMGESWDKTVDTTQEYYKEYINTDPVIDYDKRDWSSSEEKMATLFTPVDKPIDDLGVYLNRVDRFPGDQWFEELFASFPWIGGVAVVTLDGQVAHQRPETSLKPLDFGPAQEIGQDLADRRLRAYADMSPLGPEMYLVTGMFKGNDLAGFITVHFDFRSVIKFCPEPQELMVLSGEDVLWSGGRDADAQAAAELPWEEILAEETHGTFEQGGVEYTWLTRYIGDDQLVYATPAVEGSAQDDGWFFGLF